MKFMMTFNWAPDTEVRAEGIERFQSTGGEPPEGVQLLGRGTRTDRVRSFFKSPETQYAAGDVR